MDDVNWEEEEDEDLEIDELGEESWDSLDEDEDEDEEDDADEDRWSD